MYRCRRSPRFREITISEVNMAVSERHSTVDHLPQEGVMELISPWTNRLAVRETLF